MMLTNWCLVVAVLFAAVLAPSRSPAQEPPKAPETIAVSSEDALLWERYQLLSRLAAAQQDLLRLQNEKTLAEEYAKLDARWHDHYKMSVNQVERRGEQWIPRQTPPASAK